jgi:hypothetical protein
MTNEERDTQLAAIRRELERQDEAWARVKRALLARGNREILVPREFFRALDQVNDTNPPVHLGVRA